MIGYDLCRYGDQPTALCSEMLHTDLIIHGSFITQLLYIYIHTVIGLKDPNVNSHSLKNERSISFSSSLSHILVHLLHADDLDLDLTSLPTSVPLLTCTQAKPARISSSIEVQRNSKFTTTAQTKLKVNVLRW